VAVVRPLDDAVDEIGCSNFAPGLQGVAFGKHSDHCVGFTGGPLLLLSERPL
jgi:hypothetical protein